MEVINYSIINFDPEEYKIFPLKMLDIDSFFVSIRNDFMK